MNDEIKKKVAVLKSSNLFTYNTDLGRIVDQQSILLTLAGYKPVSILTANKWLKTSTGRVSVPANNNKIHDFLYSLGLQYSIQDDDHATTVIISLDANLITKCLDNADSDEITGELFGYPKTATEAFGDNSLMMSLDEQDEIMGSNDLPLFMPTFRFSKLHFKVELEVLKNWYNVLKQYDFTE